MELTREAVAQVIGSSLFGNDPIGNGIVRTAAQALPRKTFEALRDVLEDLAGALQPGDVESAGLLLRERATRIELIGAFLHSVREIAFVKNVGPDATHS